MQKEPITVLFYGPSGAGKGTQALLLKQFLERHDPGRETEYVETGALVRSFQEEEGRTQRLVREIVDSGGLLPSFVPIYLWTKFLIEKLEGDENLLLDGLARRDHEVTTLHEALQFYGRKEYKIVSFELDRKSAVERLLSRNRGDDLNEGAIHEKMDWYEKNVVPAIHMFKKLDIPVHHIDAEPSIEDVHTAVLEELELISLEK